MRFTVSEERPLFELLCEKLQQMSKSGVRKMLQQGAVTVDGEPVTRGNVTVRAGGTIAIERARRAQDATAPVSILYEDHDLIAVNKPPGILSIATDKERTRTLYRTLNDFVQSKSHGRERIFIVHRLDREVSGVMLFAKNEKAQETLQRSWGSAEKLYSALVEGRPPEAEGTVRSWLYETSAHNVRSGSKGPDSRLAITHYRQVKLFPEHALLEVRLETGRKHQIRVHLADIGCPVVGDRRYGAGQSPIGRMGLCAFSLVFEHPSTKHPVKLLIPIPAVMREFRGR